MSAVRWTHVSLLLMLLHVTAGQNPSFIVREGDDVTLPCQVVQYQLECDYTSWLFSGSDGFSSVIRPVKVSARIPADRLGMTESCALLIKNVTAKDRGVYTCTQFIRETRNSQVGLFVTTMTERRNAVFTRLSCSVSQLGSCDHTVRWLFRGRYVEEDLDVPQPPCSDAVLFPLDYLRQVDDGTFKCEVRHRDTGPMRQFDFSPQSSDEAATTARSTPGATTTTTTTTTPPTTTTTTTTQARADCSAVNYIMLVMRVAELVFVTAITVLLIRARGRQRPPDDHTEPHGEDQHGGTVKYENIGELSASVKLDNLHANSHSAQK